MIIRSSSHGDAVLHVALADRHIVEETDGFSMDGKANPSWLFCVRFWLY